MTALMISAIKAKLDAQRAALVVEAPKLQPQELFLQIGRKHYQVASIAEAVEMHNAARDNAEHGASGMPRVTIVNAHGTHLYRISYNGRVWDGDKPLDGMNGEAWRARFTVYQMLRQNEVEPRTAAGSLD